MEDSLELGTVSVVATPIGNLGDITLRAIETLKRAEVIFCEDTRMTGKLMHHLEIEKTELVRADAEKELYAAERAVECLQEGKDIAYVSDAGTPGVSDPGARLVAHIRKELPEAVIATVPGVSAVTALLSIAGVSSDSFTFLGFVPHKKGRETFFKSLAVYSHPVIFFESPHRVTKTLAALAEHQPSARLYIGRELTKLHEEVVIGTPEEMVELFTEHPEKVRGEFVIIAA